MRISKEFRFEASHILPHHPGKCRNLHGHSWRLEVVLHGQPNPNTHFVLDYYDLGRIMNPLVDALDHTHLNFILTYPSSENLVLRMAYELESLRCDAFPAILIRISETQKTWAEATAVDLEDIAQRRGYSFVKDLCQLPDPQAIIDGSIVKPEPEAILAVQKRWTDACSMAARAIADIKGREGWRA